MIGGSRSRRGNRPTRFEQQERIRTFEKVTRIQPHERGFLLTSREVGKEAEHQYMAAGIGLVVIAMHGTTYAIAGDILQKEGLL